jgi:protein-tyrosine phosphatase
MLDVLIVCTANQCRSPLAEAILSRRLSDEGAVARVHSAGLYESGWPATEEAREVAAGAGLDLTGHQSTQVTAEMVRSADLVVTMARAHARHVTALAPERSGRVFPLKELVRRAEAEAPPPAGRSLGDWLVVLKEGQGRQAWLADDADEDVADPVGLGLDAYRRTFAELDGLLRRLAPFLLPFATGPLDRPV